ncbi:hypothetical protein [Hufsiella ginkgonis]|uniref:Beta-carotene 15,15'-monooxygenase n=1 Tax=Hufsiella ginkgonis TaxID=2695274 RepID=A0A7K1XVL0_9SPHI|nr:hypothetical protein [Hufsiella ginkgonis]MXV15033.1 hypothetical protein [Hufsiella ginkgonis]
MIEFLKESTFAVNDIIHTSWRLLKEQYFLIAGLCFLMFETLNISGSMAQYLSGDNLVLRVPIMFCFILIYFGLQLTLFNFTIRLIDKKGNLDEESTKVRTYNYLRVLLYLLGAAFVFSVIIAIIVFVCILSGVYVILSVQSIISLGIICSLIWNRKRLYPFVVVIKNNWPRGKQMLNFLVATIYSVVLLFLAFIVMAVVFLPFIYLHIRKEVVAELAVSLGLVLAIIVLIRISFFPLFIMDRNCSAWKSIRFSLAITRGNFTRLLLLLGFLALFHFLSLYFLVKEYEILLFAVSVVSSFFIVPLSSITTSVAYRQMIGEYKGDEDPDLIHHII